MHPDIELDTAQRFAVANLRSGSILNGPVGSGKSRTALTFFIESVIGGTVESWDDAKNPVDLYIITTAKKRDTQDWQSDVVLFNLSTDRELSRSCIQVTVDSWNNIHKYTEVANAFFIFDEQRVVGSGSWSGGFIRIARQNSWILLSATPGDTWLDYIPVFVANGFYKNRTAFKREHVVYNNFTKYPKVERYLNVGKLIRLRNRVLVDLPYKKLTTREFTEIRCAFDADLYERVVKDRWHVYEERPLRDSAELVSVMRKVVNSDASRVGALKKILKDHSKVIVFYNFDYELEMLRGLCLTSSPMTDTGSYTNAPSTLEKITLSEEKTKWNSCATSKDATDKNQNVSSKTPDIEESTKLGQRSTTDSIISKHTNTPQEDTFSSEVVIAEWNGHKHEPVPESARWVYLVQYAAGSEGWNCVETDAMVFFSMSYSYKMFEQAQGRIDRRNTPFSVLKYYVFTSDSTIDKMISRALKLKKNFNERAFRAKIEQKGDFDAEITQK